MHRSPRVASPIVRLALLAQGVYLLVISTVPFVRLLRAPDGVVDRNLLVLQYTLWSVVPAVALLVAGWMTRRPLEPLALGALRGGAMLSTAYLGLGRVLSLADPSTSADGNAIALIVLTAVGVGAVGLARLSPSAAGAGLTRTTSLPQGSVSRSTTTIR